MFCDKSSREIIELLKRECKDVGVEILTGTRITSVGRKGHFQVTTDRGPVEAHSLVVATGGLSIPKLGASEFGYTVAQQFGLRIVEPRPGLVPLTLGPRDRRLFGALSGVSLDVIAQLKEVEFRENLLFTHRGLSGPVILQISSYWSEGEALTLNLLPETNASDFLLKERDSKSHITTLLDRFLPRRFTQIWFDSRGGPRPMHRYSQHELKEISNDLTAWQVNPSGTEGYSKAEVTVGGVDTDELSSKTMEAKKVPGLYFVGEIVDVTGWLGGYNFQWAWSSGWVAGQYV